MNANGSLPAASASRTSAAHSFCTNHSRFVAEAGEMAMCIHWPLSRKLRANQSSPGTGWSAMTSLIE